MSENLNRSTEGFSKYDPMSIGELEEILRADAMGPERDDSDVDEILYVMEVLAKKRRQNGVAGKTALEAYQEFQQHYLPMVEEESVSKHKATVILFRRIAAIAASLVLVFTLTTSANAFSFKDIWNAVARWAEETFSFSIGVEVSKPTPSDSVDYESFQIVLDEAEINVPLAPTWIPDGYELTDIIISESPIQKSYLAIYMRDEEMLKVSVKSFLCTEPEQIEQSNSREEIYTSSGIDYYILANNQLTQAAWIIDTYECYIAGNVTVNEIKFMIDSIGKGYTNDFE